MPRSTAGDALRGALTRQFGASARGIIDEEVSRRLSVCKDQRLGREDIDAIERSVLAAVRGSRRTGGLLGGAQPSSPEQPSPLGSSASAPALRIPQSAWAGDTSHIQRSPPRPGAEAAGSAAPSTTGTVGVNGGSSVDLGRASLRRAAQVRPRLKEPDHFDLMVQYADEQHQQGERAKQEKRRAMLADFRTGLETQLAEQRLQRERDQEEQRRWSQVVQKKADEFCQDQAAEARTKLQQMEEYRRHAEGDAERLIRRKEKEAQGRLREREELDKVMDVERKLQQREQQAKREVLEKRSKDARENFEASATEKSSKQAAEVEESKALAATAKKMSEQREAEANAPYRERQRVVDGLTSTLGTVNAEVLATLNKTEEERIDRHHQHWKRKRVADYWRQVEDKQRAVDELNMTNRTMASTWKSVQGADERARSVEQSVMWRRQDAEHNEASRRKAELRRRTRDRIDDDLMEVVHGNARVHNTEFGVTVAIKAREMAYHKSTIDRMAVEGFRKDLSQPLARTAATLTLRAG